MEKTIIKVPEGIRYINEFEELYGFHLEDYPYILDKSLPGCGFTFWALTNSQNVILASPRRMLMENKKGQLGDQVFLVTLETEDSGIDKDLTRFSKHKKEDKQKPEFTFDKVQMEHDISKYMLERRFDGLPIKILVTYDSYKKVKEFLEARNIFQEFYTIVDEFQSLLIDSKFKSTTELEFLSVLSDVQRVCYVSATPMMEAYLELIPTFANLPYHVLDWMSLDPNRIKDPQIHPRDLRSVNLAAKSIIDSYKKGKFECKLYIDPETGEAKNVVSREAVIFVNSVSNIIGIIKACNLMPDDVNILCSRTSNNASKIKAKLNRPNEGIYYKIGEIPKLNEPRKMFTLCTRTVYLGADFYSDNARTFIISDANIDTLAVDISLDLPQILGRQRLAENPWKDDVVIYIKPTMRVNAISYEEYMRVLKEKLKRTEDLLRSYESAPDDAKSSLIEVYSDRARDYNYKNDYVAVNRQAGSSPIPVRNDLVILAEHRAFEIQQFAFKNRCTVFNELARVGKIVTSPENTVNIQHVIDKLSYCKGCSDKLRYLCNLDVNLNESELKKVFNSLSNSVYENIYYALGPERCKALGYNYSRLKKEYDIKFFNTSLVDEAVQAEFKEGERLENSYIKTKLAKIYEDLDYKKTAKANDINNWFETRICKVKNSKGSWIKGIELLKLKK